MSPASRTSSAAGPGAALWLFSLLAGCQPQIGDDCRRDLDCSQRRDRVCDTTQEGGYCTQYNCSPTSCPKGEAVCVAFNNNPASVEGCSNPGRPSPYARNFCMRPCETDTDCRSGYACVNVNVANPWGARIIQLDSTQTSICIVPVSLAPVEEDRSNQVCLGPGPGGATGAGGVGGTAGAQD